MGCTNGAVKGGVCWTHGVVVKQCSVGGCTNLCSSTGHGGLMDRFDCQLIMALATWEHYNTFVKITTVSVSKLLYMYKLLGDEEMKEFLDKITATTTQIVTPSGV